MTEPTGKEDHQDLLAHQDHQDFQEQPGLRETLDNLALEDMWDCRDLLGRTAAREPQESPGPRANPERMVNQGEKGISARQELRVHQDSPAPMALRVCLAQQGLQEQKERLDKTDNQVHLVTQACGDPQAHREILACQV